MASPEVLSQLAAIESSTSSQGDKSASFIALLKPIINDSPPTHLEANLTAFVDTILSDSVGIVTSRPVLSEFLTAIPTIPSSPRIRESIYSHALTKISPKIVSFEQQDCTIRLALAQLYEDAGDNPAAARVLQGIQLNPHQRQITDEFRLEVYVRIMRNLLEDDDDGQGGDAVAADAWLNRATLLIHKTSDPKINLTFQLCQARVLDGKRQFLNACSKYHFLSFSALVAEADKMECLSAAMTCAILAPAGPLRSRSLATLYKDERAPQLRADYALLEKMYLDRLISAKEVDEFAARLKPHQKTLRADGTTVLSEAVVEHNLLAASRLYANVGVVELGALLGLEGDRAEEYAARMIEQKRLNGQIDQIDGLIYFEAGGSGVVAGTAAGGGGGGGVGAGAGVAAPGGGGGGVGRQIRKWDENVAALAQEVENITSMLQNECPEFVAKHLVT